MTKPFLDQDTFRRICDVIRQKAGLHFGEHNRYFLEKRLDGRLEVTGAPDFRSYLQHILYGDSKGTEFQNLLNAITTQETYFWRESRQLECFRDEIVPLLLHHYPSETLRIWSAGCSTGEEPYTLSILLEGLKTIHHFDYEIFATDISTRALDRAKKGVYGRTSFRAVNETFQRRHFHKEGSFQKIADRYREKVKFRQINLLSPEGWALLPPLHAIFCRNVLIYFDSECKIKVVHSFHDRLQNLGFLLLGHSESLITLTERFYLVHMEKDLVYVKGTL